MYAELALRDEINALLHSFRSEVTLMIDTQIKQWDFEYRKDHLDLKRKFEETR